LTPFESRAASVKVKRLLVLREQNSRLQAQVSRFEQIQRGAGGMPPNTTLLMKVFDEDTSQTQIVRINSDYGVDEIAAIAGAVLRRAAMLLVHISPSKAEQLTPESLHEGYGSVCREEQPGLVVRAI
jgi:hypothetical protein